MARVAEAAQAGDVHQLAALSSYATECERLIADVQDIDRRYQGLSSFSNGLPDELGARTFAPAPTRPRSAKRDGAEMRAQWVADMKSKGIDLEGYGKRYLAPSRATVGLAPANELPGKPNRWFSGLPDEPTDIAVLLCRSYSGSVYDLVLPVRL